MRLIVTGSSSGIGLSLTKQLLSQGHEIWGLARSEQAKHHNNFKSNICDVSVWKSVESTAKVIAQRWSDLDGLIHCAGSQGSVGPSMSLDPQEWSRTVSTNLDGLFYTLRAFYPLLEKSPSRTKIICFSGGGATGPRPNFSAYAAAKAGLVRLVETLACEWKNLPIDINAIAPGAIKTRLTEEIIQLGPEKVGENEFNQATKVMKSGGGSIDKVFELVQFLLSEQSDGVTGKLLAAQWDPWKKIPENRESFASSETYTLRRVVPKEWS